MKPNFLERMPIPAVVLGLLGVMMTGWATVFFVLVPH
jgi:hypothetical protein